MDVLAYEYMLENLKAFNDKAERNHGNKIYSAPPVVSKDRKISYPITIFEEIRNVAIENNNYFCERVASVGYQVDIYAQDKGTKVKKTTVAREVAQIVDEYLSGIGLTRVSFNVSSLENNGALCRIMMTYSGNLYENSRRLI